MRQVARSGKRPDASRKLTCPPEALFACTASHPPCGWFCDAAKQHGARGIGPL